MSKQDYTQEHKNCLDNIKAVLNNEESDFTKIFTISGIANKHADNPKYEDEGIEGLFPCDNQEDITSSSQTVSDV